MAKETRDKSDIVCNFCQSAEDVPDPRELGTEEKKLSVFDNMLLEKQNTCESYYVRRRHSNVDFFYLAQKYFKLPRQTIKQQANFVSLFPQDPMNLNHIFEDLVGNDASNKEFR